MTRALGVEVKTACQITSYTADHQRIGVVTQGTADDSSQEEERDSKNNALLCGGGTEWKSRERSRALPRL